jgi:ketosteroid isomerase-like protein
MNNMKPGCALILVCGAWLLGCTAQPAFDLEAETLALKKAAEDYHNHAPDVVSLYAPGARMMPPGRETVQGLESIREFTESFKLMSELKINFSEPEVKVASGGGMGYTIAIATISFTDEEGVAHSSTSRDFHLWEKQADGSWKLVVDIWSDLPDEQPDTN